MATLPTVDFTLKYERRLCKVKNELGYFHCWEHYSEPSPAGFARYVSGIVEFEDGVRHVDPTEIKFCDEEHANLCALNKYEKERCTNEEK